MTEVPSVSFVTHPCSAFPPGVLRMVVVRSLTLAIIEFKFKGLGQISVPHTMEGAAPGDGKVVLDEGKVCGQDGKLADYKIVQPIGEALTPLSPLSLHTHWRDVCRLLSYRLPVAAAPPTSCAVAWPTAVCYGAQVQLGCIFALLLARPPPPACSISILPPPAPATLHHTHPPTHAPTLPTNTPTLALTPLRSLPWPPTHRQVRASFPPYIVRVVSQTGSDAR